MFVYLSVWRDVCNIMAKNTVTFEERNLIKILSKNVGSKNELTHTLVLYVIFLFVSDRCGTIRLDKDLISYMLILFSTNCIRFSNLSNAYVKTRENFPAQTTTRNYIIPLTICPYTIPFTFSFHDCLLTTISLAALAISILLIWIHHVNNNVR